MQGSVIDEERNKLMVSGRAPVSVVEMPAWKLHRDIDHSGGFDRRCWSSVYQLIQSDALIEGSYMDYQVEDVFSTGFKFEGL